MLIFKKVMGSLLLPPGIFIFILIIAGIFLCRRSWKAGLLDIIIGLLLWALSVAPVSDALTRGLEAGLTAPPQPRGDVIIMLGGGLYRNMPTGETSQRIVAAATLYRVLHAPVIVSGGAAFPFRKPEAPVDARVLTGLGVPSDKILIEDKSRDTLENAEYSKEICKKNHFKDPLVVTSAIHMKRALLCFERVRMPATGYPVDLSKERMNYRWEDYLPGERNASGALHEYLGIIYTRLTGFLGGAFTGILIQRGSGA